VSECQGAPIEKKTDRRQVSNPLNPLETDFNSVVVTTDQLDALRKAFIGECQGVFR
jgi:hypothetical protein